MTIKKQEFYEGAALHLLASTERIVGIMYRPPFFVLNGRIFLMLKYSTRGRSPWGFTFTESERARLEKVLVKDSKRTIKIGLICGADGIVALDYDEFLKITGPRTAAVHVSCYRKHGEYYEVNGPDGTLDRKVPPSNWQKLFD